MKKGVLVALLLVSGLSWAYQDDAEITIGILDDPEADASDLVNSIELPFPVLPPPDSVVENHDRIDQGSENILMDAVESGVGTELFDNQDIFEHLDLLEPGSSVILDHTENTLQPLIENLKNSLPVENLNLR